MSENDMVDPEIKNLLDRFGIDHEFGFLLKDPLIKLSEKYHLWHELVDDLPQLIQCKNFDQKIKNLPLIDTNQIRTYRELRLAHLLLSTIASGYIWADGPQKPKLLLPKQIAIPLYEVSQAVGLKPIICHASACLANYQTVNQISGHQRFKADDMKLIAARFIKHRGNEWFFLVAAQVEYELAPAHIAILIACHHLKLSENTLITIRNSLLNASDTMKRMNENLPPEVFYRDLRVFLSGYNYGHIASCGGIIFEGVELEPQQLSGASAAQSSSLHLIDAFLGIKHSGSEAIFLAEQCAYMPKEHCDFIEWVRLRRAQIMDFRHDKYYNEAIDALKLIRSQHFALVTDYIIKQMEERSLALGTGGSNFITLLNNIRKNCQSELINQ